MARPDAGRPPELAATGDVFSLVRAFLAAYQEGSTGAAARVLGLSQPTVSRQVAALEGRLGYAVFERGRDGLRPTPAAHRLAGRLTGPMQALLHAVPAVRTGAVPVTIGSSADLLAALVVPAIAPLVASGTQFTMSTSLPGSPGRQAELGLLDLLVLPTIPPGLSRRFQIEHLLTERFMLVAAPAWRAGLPDDGPRRLAAIRESIPLLALAVPPPMARRWWREAAGQAPPTPALALPDARALRDAAVLGAGAVVLPSFLIAAALRGGTLVELVQPAVPVANDIHVAYRKDHPRPDAIRAVVTALIDYHDAARPAPG